MQGALTARLAPASSSRAFVAHRRSRSSIGLVARGRGPLPTLCIAGVTNGAAAPNGNGANGTHRGQVDLEGHSVRDARGLCLSPLGQEAVMKEIDMQKASGNKKPQKVSHSSQGCCLLNLFTFGARSLQASLGPPLSSPIISAAVHDRRLGTTQKQ